MCVEVIVCYISVVFQTQRGDDRFAEGAKITIGK